MKMESASLFLAFVFLVAGSAYCEIAEDDVIDSRQYDGYDEGRNWLVDFGRGRRDTRLNSVRTSGGGVLQVNQNMGNGARQSNTMIIKRGSRSADGYYQVNQNHGDNAEQGNEMEIEMNRLRRDTRTNWVSIGDDGVAQVNQNMGNGARQSNTMTIKRGSRSADGYYQVNQNHGDNAEQGNEMEIEMNRLRRDTRINSVSMSGGGVGQVNQNMGNGARQSNTMIIKRGSRSADGFYQVNQNHGDNAEQGNEMEIEMYRKRRDLRVSQVSNSNNGQGRSTSTIEINGCRYVEQGTTQNGNTQVNSAVISAGQAPFVMINGRRYSVTSCNNGGTIVPRRATVDREQDEEEPIRN